MYQYCNFVKLSISRARNLQLHLFFNALETVQSWKFPTGSGGKDARLLPTCEPKALRRSAMRSSIRSKRNSTKRSNATKNGKIFQSLLKRDSCNILYMQVYAEQNKLTPLAFTVAVIFPLLRTK